jgi:eukaryotic-like serine/threonine-protein kinase
VRDARPDWRGRDGRGVPGTGHTLGRTVAIEVSADRFTERFQREAQAIASLNHAHICTLSDVGPDYLVREFIDGKGFKGPLPIGEALTLGVQIAEAVSYAHRHGVVHHDLKPGTS